MVHYHQQTKFGVRQCFYTYLSFCPRGRSPCDVTSYLAAWSRVPSRGSLSRVSLSRGLCPGGSLSGRLCPGGLGVSVQRGLCLGDLCRKTPQTDTSFPWTETLLDREPLSESEKRVVCILLECFLVCENFKEMKGNIRQKTRFLRV